MCIDVADGDPFSISIHSINQIRNIYRMSFWRLIWWEFGDCCMFAEFIYAGPSRRDEPTIYLNLFLIPFKVLLNEQIIWQRLIQV